MFAPLNVKVADPTLVKLPGPWIRPLNVVALLSLPADNVVSLARSTIPAPAIDPTVSLAATP